MTKRETEAQYVNQRLAAHGWLHAPLNEYGNPVYGSIYITIGIPMALRPTMTGRKSVKVAVISQNGRIRPVV